MVWALALLIIGLLLLWRGADFLVGGAVGLAGRLGISHLIVGLTVVAMGTSAPEMATAIAAAIRSHGDIVMGNVYGSNVANLALIGGLIALIRPLQVQATTLRREIPAMLGVALLLWPALRDLAVSRIDALALLAVFGVLLTHTIRTARLSGARQPVDESYGVVAPPRTIRREIVFVVVGLAALAIGARAAISGAVTIGTRIGLSDAVIGSTIIAIGTSLPELVTCLVAAIKGHHDISVGNLVGSNIFNTLLVTGLAGFVHPFVIGARFAGGTDYWIMIGVSLAFIVAIVAGGRAINRIGGTILLAMYAAYMIYLLRSSSPA
jgi:cation:H+ antiporter